MEDSSSLDVRVREMPGWVITGLSFSDQGKTAVRTLSAVGQGVLIGVIWVAILSPAVAGRWRRRLLADTQVQGPAA